YEYPGRHS
ncbi:unnamed protein product, partial [Callosobruchus maculatus]